MDLDRVLWVNCGGNAQHALKSTDLLIQAGGFGLVVLDMADTADAVARRIPLASWFRLRHAAERTGAALVAVERQINARSCSTLQIEMRLKKPLWIGKLLRGMMAQAESRKHYRSQVGGIFCVRGSADGMFACLHAPGNLPLAVECARGFSPYIEENPPDTVIFDVRGLESLYGPPERLAREIERRIGVPASIAIAANPDAAMHAAHGIRGVTVIAPGREAECWRRCR